MTITKPDIQTARDVTAYLNGLPRCRNVRPVRVTIKGEVFYGARYDDVRKYEASMTAVISGRHKAGEEYIEDTFYLVGKLPKCRARRPRATCFPFESFDWYVACYSPEVIPAQVAEFHPFGHSFMMMPWTLPNAIDEWEPKPYSRFPMTVELID